MSTFPDENPKKKHEGREDGGESCEHCGGSVGPDGLAMAAGGEQYEDAGDEETDQHKSGRNMSRVSSAFADAVRTRR